MDLKYPIGTFHQPEIVTNEIVQQWIRDIEQAPVQLREAVKDLSDAELDVAYRPGGWTIRQVVHHLPDSHMNSYIRFKLALTEEAPTIRPYYEDRWAELPDSKLPIEGSLQLLASVHYRWVFILQSLGSNDLERTLIHPESGEVDLAESIGLYAWHGKHHIAQIDSLRNRMGW